MVLTCAPRMPQFELQLEGVLLDFDGAEWLGSRGHEPAGLRALEGLICSELPELHDALPPETVLRLARIWVGVERALAGEELQGMLQVAASALGLALVRLPPDKLC